MKQMAVIIISLMTFYEYQDYGIELKYNDCQVIVFLIFLRSGATALDLDG